MQVDIEKGIESGYLERRKVVFKPITRGMSPIKDNAGREINILDGAVRSFVPKMLNNYEYVPIFKNKEEQKFFEETMGIPDLSRGVSNKFWDTFYIDISTQNGFEKTGKVFDLSKPLENLQVRELKAYGIVTTNENELGDQSKEYSLLDIDFKDSKSAKLMDKKMKAFEHYSSIAGSMKKLREFIEVYNITMKSNKVVPEDVKDNWYTSELYTIMETDVDNYLMVANDTTFLSKVILKDALACGAINRTGVNSYVITGQTNNFNLDQIVNLLSDDTSDEYHQIRQQIKLMEKTNNKANKK